MHKMKKTNLIFSLPNHLLRSEFLLKTILVLSCFSFTCCSGREPVTNATESLTTAPIPGAWQTKMYFPLLEGKRIAFAGNHTSTIFDVHIVDSLLNAGFNVVKVFSPEHGFRGVAAAGEHVKSGTDVATGLPVISLYGENRRPNPFHLTDVDIILFDIQDVGTRFYTYISTMSYIMEAAAKQDIPVVILDRPNPNGHYVDGPVLEPDYKSFVGLHPIPVVHGMTIGEYALMVNDMGWLGENIVCDLTIITVANYEHKTFFEPPIFPSPNLPNILSIHLYPSLCFFEGTPISVGRGTDFPFQAFGNSKLPSSNYPFQFTPESRSAAPNPPELGKLCYGMDLRGINIEDLRNNPFIDLSYLIEAYKLFSEKEKFFNNFFNLLAGNKTLQEQIVNGVPIDDIRLSWQKDLDNFKQIRKRFLLYPDFE